MGAAVKKTAEPARALTAVALFGGGGLMSLGLESAQPGWRGVSARIHVVASVDAWPVASRVHEYLCPSSRAVTMDLFTREDYEAFHGHAPPPGWREATPADLRALCPEGPDILMTSAPCKGFSANLSEAKAVTPKYQALGRLTLRGLWLALEAWRGCLPRLILFENVPRIRSRGAELLRDIRVLLRDAGYAVDDRDHDAGELGGLAQTRRRFLLAARLKTGAPFPVHLPVRRPLRGVGEVLSQVPCPVPWADDLPPMHRVAAGQHWITALRLALIRAGRDWRDLRRVVAYEVRWSGGQGYWLVGALYEGAEAWTTPPGWDEAEPRGGWVTDDAGLLSSWMGEGRTHPGYRMREWGETAGTVGSHGGCATGGAWSFAADPRLPHVKFNNAFRLVGWEERGVAVTGGAGPTSGGQCVADPRLGCSPRRGTYGVMDWSETSPTVAASVDVHAGTAAVMDPRLGVADVPRADELRRGIRPAMREAVDLGARVAEGDRPDLRRRAASVRPAEMACRPAYLPLRRDLPWGHIPTEEGAGDARGMQAPAPTDRGAWVILSPDGSWHRPCTTLEVALLQGLPAVIRGAPLDFYALGLSDGDAREVIGNGVPPPAAEAVGVEFGQALLEADGVIPVRLLLGGRWVMPGVPIADGHKPSGEG